MQKLATLSLREAWTASRESEPVKKAAAILEKEASRLDFDPVPHVYMDRETGFVPVCVSDVVDSFAAFDAVRKARALSRRDGGRPGAKYYGMSPEAILAAWKEKADRAADNGTVLHSFAEACFCVSVGEPGGADGRWLGRISDDGRSIDALTPQEAGIVQAFGWMPDHLVPVRKESRLYERELGYAGTMDLLSYDTRAARYVLQDWKTNESLDKGHFERMKAPFGHLWDTSLSHYVIQQNLYQIRLESLGIRVAWRFLLHVDPYGLFTPVPVERCTDVLTGVLRERKAAGLAADGKPVPAKCA